MACGCCWESSAHRSKEQTGKAPVTLAAVTMLLPVGADAGSTTLSTLTALKAVLADAIAPALTTHPPLAAVLAYPDSTALLAPTSLTPMLARHPVSSAASGTPFALR